MAEGVLQETESKMQKAVEALKRDLAGIRTGRASPALLQNIKVDYYGVPTPLSQMANITAPDPRFLVVQPYDRSVLTAVEKAILKSDLGLVPSNDGTNIKLPIPPLSEERRNDLVKLVKKRTEEGKVALRNVRRDAMETLKAQEKEKAISQDEHTRSNALLQKLIDGYTVQVNKVGEAKETELLKG